MLLFRCQLLVIPIVQTFLLGAVLEVDAAAPLKPCKIIVRDDENGWPVPLVELRTTHNVRFTSDNAGVIAFDLPELMGVETWFHVEGHGYSVKPDGFGYRGVKLTPKPGGTIEVKVHRELPGKRLGRITGGGIFGESQQIGEELDWTEQKILGCDSVQNAVHNGRLYWGWGDTTLPGYPLGRFHMIGATTTLQPLESFQPPIRLQYDYFADHTGTPRNVAKMPGEGPTWLSGFVSLKDKAGKAHLVATYSKIKPPLSEYERGLCVWNEETKVFDKFKVLWTTSDDQRRPPNAPIGHVNLWTDESGAEWALFGDPMITLRCRASFESWSNPDAWEAVDGQQAPLALGTGKPITPHRGAIAWNEFRQKWVMIFTQYGGDTSAFGEIWYAESHEPTGPWGNAVKVVTHNKYTFYNPQLHPEFTKLDSPILLFEATFTHTFSKTHTPTPRQDYNQVLYRLDLDELGEMLDNR
ncbi:MAG: hypothetical protein R3C18_06745 [Planctomycetaceae bacterium]